MSCWTWAWENAGWQWPDRQTSGMTEKGPCHPAFSQAQVQQLIDSRLIFRQDILTHHADIGGAPLYIDAYIRWLDPEAADSRLQIFKGQLSGIVGVLLKAVSGLGQHFQHLVPQPSLGKRNINKITQPPSPLPG